MKALDLVAVMAAAGAARAEAPLRRIAPRLVAIAAGGMVAFALPPAARRFGFGGNPRRARMQALVLHRRLLEAACLAGPLLPGAFGAGATDADDLRAGLRRHAPRLARELAASAGLVEFQIAVSADPRGTVEHLATAADFAALRGEIAGLPPAAAGARLAHAAAALHAALRGRALSLLSDTAEDIAERPPGGGEEVFAAALLIREAETARLDAALEALDAGPPGGLKIRCAGPLPPVSFRALAFAVAAPEETAALLGAFGLGEGATAADAARAWRRAARAGDLAAAAGVAERGRRLEALLAPGIAGERGTILLEIGDEARLAAARAAPGGGARAA